MTPTSQCPGPLDRRTWLQLGGVSLGALSSGLPIGLPELLAFEKTAKPQAAADDFAVILFWANGGPSHLDLFDLKPHAPAEIRGPFRPIRTAVPGMEITEELPNLAKLADKIAIVRSLKHTRNEHSGGTNRFLTGYASKAANPASSEYPEIGSVVAKCLEKQVKDIPLFVANTQFYGGGPAYLGQAHAPYMPAPKNAISASGNNTYDPIPIYPTPGDTNPTRKRGIRQPATSKSLAHASGYSRGLALPQQAADKLRRRAELLKTFDTLNRNIDASGSMAAMDQFRRQALQILVSPRTRDAFDISQETPATRRAYGDTHWGRSLLTCRRLVEAGVRFVQCQATYRLKKETGRTTSWDDHSVNADIFKAYREKLPSFDQSVPALIQDLHDRGLNKRVLFVFAGEFGRTPRIRHQDKSKRPGRDHWARAMSVLLAGGGLKMGQVIGATNRKAEDPTDRIMNSNCLLATIYHRFGIDISRHFIDNTGRPVPVLTDGEAIGELIS